MVELKIEDIYDDEKEARELAEKRRREMKRERELEEKEKEYPPPEDFDTFGNSPPGGLPTLQEGEGRTALETDVFSTPSPSPTGRYAREDKRPEKEEEEFREVVIDGNGMPRMAGSDSQEGRFIQELREKAEKSLFLFCKAVLGYTFLTSHFHREVCEFVQKTPPFRKLIMLPREHAKTLIVSNSYPLHILIQGAERNIYFPGLDGSECRILLCGETETMAKKNLRVLAETHAGNRLFRSLWREKVWEKPKSQAKEWSSTALIWPRKNEWPDPTLRAVGVGGAITGARPNVLVKDDLVSFEAANSDVVMDRAIEWHIASRALLDTYEVESGLQSLETIVGTRWAVFDLYSYIIDRDPSVEVINEKFHRIIRDGRILWPEKNTHQRVRQLKREHGANFYLLYLNSAADPELTDFDLNQVRDFRIKNGIIEFKEDERDERLKGRYENREEHRKRGGLREKERRGEKVDWGSIFGRDEYFRLKRG